MRGGQLIELRRTKWYVESEKKEDQRSRWPYWTIEVSQANKGIRWMPRRQEPKKDGVSSEKPWGAASKH